MLSQPPGGPAAPAPRCAGSPKVRRTALRDVDCECPLYLAEPLDKALEQSPGHVGVRLQEGPELPLGEHQAPQGGSCHDVGRTGGSVDHGHLTEVLPGAEPLAVLAVY